MAHENNSWFADDSDELRRPQRTPSGFLGTIYAPDQQHEGMNRIPPAKFAEDDLWVPDGDENQQRHEPESTDPSPVQALPLIFVSLLLPIFCLSLDNTILATAVPRITHEFSSIKDIAWYGASYFMTSATLQLVYGKLYTLFPTKTIYLVAVLIFEVGSAICGAAPTSWVLIIGRAIAGVGAAGILTGSVQIIAQTVPIEKRPTYIGLIGATYGIASVVGPVLGGVLTERASWRWCFFLNLPIGAGSMLVVMIFYRPKGKVRTTHTWKDVAKRFDILGLLCFLAMIVCLLLALQWGGNDYRWDDREIITLLIAFGLLLIIFIGLQIMQQDNAAIPPRLLKSRTVIGVCWVCNSILSHQKTYRLIKSQFMACLAGTFYVCVYYIPIWFQVVKGASPIQSGVRTFPMVIAVSLMSVIGGVLTTKLGYYAPFFLSSAILMSIGSGLVTTFQIDTHPSDWIGFQVILGTGVGLGMQQGLIVVQTVMAPQDVPIGTALVTFCQSLGGALYLAVAQQIFTSRLVLHVHHLVPQLDSEKALASGATAASLAKDIPEALMERFLQAYNSALRDAFHVPTATAIISILGAVVLEWKSVKHKQVYEKVKTRGTEQNADLA